MAAVPRRRGQRSVRWRWWPEAGICQA